MQSPAPSSTTAQALTFVGALVLVLALWLVTNALAAAFEARRDGLADDWFKLGEADLAAHRLDAAIADYRNALAYSRENFTYRLRLAEALTEAGRPRQAKAYLLALWSEQPANSVVNRDLARLAVQLNNYADAVRYYHGAIYGFWSGDPEQQRRETRFELVNYLLRQKQTQPADAELITLSSELPRNPSELTRAAGLLMLTADYARAFSLYREAADLDRHDAVAFAGAGKAAFLSGDYLQAEHYLQRAVALAPADADSLSLQKITRLVLEMTPYQRGIPAAERSRRVVNAVHIAQQRAQQCLADQSTRLGSLLSSGDLRTDAAQLADMASSLKPAGLAQDADLVDSIINLIGRIEQDSSSVCGDPQGADRALLLIATKHQGIPQ